MDSDHDIKTRVTTLEELKVQRKGDDCLVVIYAPVPSDLGRRYVLDREVVTIGRDRENDIVLDSANVSRHHAVIIDTGTNYIVNDLRSSNGVHVRKERIRSAATLNDDDEIRICDHEFTFRIVADENAPTVH